MVFRAVSTSSTFSPPHSAARSGAVSGIAGWRPHEQLPQALHASDVLVLPSVAEAFGLALIEAMACGLPVIACNAHGPAEIVRNGTSGWLVSPDDEQALRAALLEAATNQA